MTMNSFEPPMDAAPSAPQQVALIGATHQRIDGGVRATSAKHLLLVVHDLWAFGTLMFVIAHLARLPNVERAILLYFIPPLIAWLILAINRGRIQATPITGCRLFLTMIAAAVTLGEMTFILPSLKPQFPGMPPVADRVLVFYFAAYIIFIWLICPSYVIGLMFRARRNGDPSRLAPFALYSIAGIWLGTVVLLVGSFTYAFINGRFF